MGEYKKVEEDAQSKLDFNDTKPQAIAKFLNDHYKIRVPIQDPEKLEISPRDESRWKYQPLDPLAEILLHMRDNGKSVSRRALTEVLFSPNYIEPYDPIKDYFGSLRGKYRGESHIEKLCNYITPRVFDDNTPEYYHDRSFKLIRKWLVACVACWIGGQPNDVALIFISGKGGIGKTNLIENMFPAQLGEFYRMSSKDDRLFNMTEAFARYMLVNFEELEGIGKSTINTFKSLMDKRLIDTKSYHDRLIVKRKRMACVVATTNHNQEAGGFIHAAYGDTRRFGCIEFEDIDWERYNREVDFDQVWSEVLLLYEDTSFNHIFDKNDYADFVSYNARYAYESTAMDYVRRHLSRPDGNTPGEWMNASAVYEWLLTNRKVKRDDLGAKEGKVNIQSIGTALTALGYQKEKRRPTGSRIPIWLYHVIIKEKL